ncbi:hypothetical protein [Mycobacterium hubeiense]|uniref:Rv0361 family membrane protein n=1 Tax=Mycobacterium hubeiense TaxID=1867256 RepID=UPI000C7EECA9|nr:hypothetical protein [Mycobacterium sp. QGD 101]
MRAIHRCAVLAAVLVPAVSACGGDGKGADDLPSPEREIRTAIDDFYRAQEGDFGLYKSAVCEEEVVDRFPEGTTDSEFAKEARAAVEQDGRFIVDWFDEVKVAGDTAEVSFTGHALGGFAPNIGEQRKTAKVVLVDGKWKVCGFPDDDAATKRKFAQATDTAAVQETLVDYVNAVGSGDRSAAAFLTSNECLKVFAATVDALEAAFQGTAVTSVEEITVNDDAAKAKFMVGTSNTSAPGGAALLREDGTWHVCMLDLIGPPIPKA